MKGSYVLLKSKNLTNISSYPQCLAKVECNFSEIWDCYVEFKLFQWVCRLCWFNNDIFIKSYFISLLTTYCKKLLFIKKL